jgi:hypothetical protein
MDFDWKLTAPVQHRPYKAIYHITMGMLLGPWQTSFYPYSKISPPLTGLGSGLKEASLSDLIIIDCNYTTRMTNRKVFLDQDPSHYIGVSSLGAEAVFELYAFLFSAYLPIRYPGIFTYSTSKPLQISNKILNESFPVQPPGDPAIALRHISRMIEDDFNILLPIETDRGQEYSTQAFLITPYPSAFDTLKGRILGRTLRRYHQPVPSYPEKLEYSMERWFKRLKPGKFVTRNNVSQWLSLDLPDFRLTYTQWGITTEDNLAAVESIHLYENDGEPGEKEIDFEKVRSNHLVLPSQGTNSVSQTLMRVERQFLHRLPRSRAIVFSLKTYLYPVSQIKAEGQGEALATAIEGIAKGNAPGMTWYKREVEWGSSLKRYLRS